MRIDPVICENAPAKINLYLHVGGVRADGLHDLASLFAFTEKGDVVTVAPAAELSLQIEGPFAPALAGFPVSDNLVLRAGKALQKSAGLAVGAALRLEKNLPVAAGVGGGSADAAAALRALRGLWEVDISDAALASLAFDLGADVPACLSRSPVFVEGAGEALRPAPALPACHCCLVNPRVETPTGPVFRAFDAKNQAPLAPRHPAAASEAPVDIRRLMEESRNDLQALAIAAAPVIADVLAFLEGADNVMAARMSGSGATCFALFDDAGAAAACARSANEKGWWAMASPLASG